VGETVDVKVKVIVCVFVGVKELTGIFVNVHVGEKDGVKEAVGELVSVEVREKVTVGVSIMVSCGVGVSNLGETGTTISREQLAPSPRRRSKLADPMNGNWFLLSTEIPSFFLL
jgi:hypothetical protein